MENFLTGQDSRDLLEVIAPPDTSEQQYCGSKNRTCRCQSTGDSGFSGSVPPNDSNDRTRIFDGRSEFLLSLEF